MITCDFTSLTRLSLHLPHNTKHSRVWDRGREQKNRFIMQESAFNRSCMTAVSVHTSEKTLNAFGKNYCPRDILLITDQREFSSLEEPDL